MGVASNFRQSQVFFIKMWKKLLSFNKKLLNSIKKFSNKYGLVLGFFMLKPYKKNNMKFKNEIPVGVAFGSLFFFIKVKYLTLNENEISPSEKWQKH